MAYLDLATFAHLFTDRGLESIADFCLVNEDLMR